MENDTTVAVISGEGRAFMAGADIKLWESNPRGIWIFSGKGKQLYESIKHRSHGLLQ